LHFPLFRFLLAATASTMLGPSMLLYLRNASESAALQGERMLLHNAAK
jgi:hypothetical protein